MYLLPEKNWFSLIYVYNINFIFVKLMFYSSFNFVQDNKHFKITTYKNCFKTFHTFPTIFPNEHCLKYRRVIKHICAMLSCSHWKQLMSFVYALKEDKGIWNTCY